MFFGHVFPYFFAFVVDNYNIAPNADFGKPVLRFLRHQESE